MQHEPHLTQLSSKLWWALTHEAIKRGVTLAAVLAGLAGTLVPPYFTVSAHKTRSTEAVVTPRTLLQKIEKMKWTVVGQLPRSMRWTLELWTSIPCTLLHSDTDLCSLWSLKTKRQNEYEQEFILRQFFKVLGAIYTQECAQIKAKFWKRITSEVPDRPSAVCNWACTGSRKSLSMQVQSWWQELELWTCQEENDTGYHM